MISIQRPSFDIHEDDNRPVPAAFGQDARLQGKGWRTSGPWTVKRQASSDKGGRWQNSNKRKLTSETMLYEHSTENLRAKQSENKEFRTH